MSNSHVHPVIEDILNTFAKEAATVLVERQTEGMTVEERLRRVEIQAALNESSVDALNHVASTAHKELSADLDSVLDGVMSVIFEVVAHILGRTISVEKQGEVQIRANELFKEAQESDPDLTSKNIGPFIKQAALEVLSRG